MLYGITTLAVITESYFLINKSLDIPRNVSFFNQRNMIFDPFDVK